MKNPIYTGVAVFIVIAFLTQLLTYQQYMIYKRSAKEKVSLEADAIRDKLTTSLSSSLSATKTLAFLVAKYGVPDQFDSVAKEILESNKFIDALQLTRKGVITHVYPLEGNRAAIGYDVLADTLRNQEALKALERKQLFFAGPFELRQGGIGVVGRLPIFRDNSFFGFSVVLIHLSTLLEAGGIDKPNENFVYQLSKINSNTGKEEFFLPGAIPSSGHYVSIAVPDGEWKLYVLAKDDRGVLANVLPFLILGLALSVTAGLFGWELARQPDKLRARVDAVTAQMSVYQKSATESLQRVNRLYQFTSMINHMAVHATDEKQVYDQVCKIAVNTGGFVMAWIGIIDEQETKIYVVDHYGNEEGYLSQIAPISLKPEDREGPAMRMLKTGTFVHCNDIATDPLMTRYADIALERGYRSSIILPIKRFDKIVGSFNLYSPQPNYFDDKEIHLLLETTNNISFTLENFERERLRKQAEQQIKSEKILSDMIINSMPGIFYFYDKDGKFIRWNKNFEVVSGYSGEEVKTMHPLDFFHEDEKELLKQRIGEVFINGYAEVEAEFYTKDHCKMPYFFNGRKVNFDGVDYLIGMGLDISDRVKAEKALIDRTEEIEKLSVHLQNIREEERSRIALEIHDVLGQQLTALKMDSNWLRKRSAGDTANLDRINTMIALIDDTIKTVRRISSELRPGILDDLGLIAALEWQGSEFEKNTGIEFRFETNSQEVSLDRNFSTNVFRVYQEALTNVARHSHATKVHASFMQHSDYIELTVKDNGNGIDLTEVKQKKSLGLISMKERARLFKGEVSVQNIMPRGTMVRLSLPFIKNGH